MFIAAAGQDKKIFLGKMIHENLEQFIQSRMTASTKSTQKDFPILLDSIDFPKDKQIVATIICQGDAIGSVVIPTLDNDDALAVARTGAIFLGKQMEN